MGVGRFHGRGQRRLEIRDAGVGQDVSGGPQLRHSVHVLEEALGGPSGNKGSGVFFSYGAKLTVGAQRAQLAGAVSDPVNGDFLMPFDISDGVFQRISELVLGCLLLGFERFFYLSDVILQGPLEALKGVLELREPDVAATG